MVSLQDTMTREEQKFNARSVYRICFLTLVWNSQSGTSKKTKSGLELVGTHQLLVCADNVNLFDESLNKKQSHNTPVDLDTRWGEWSASRPGRALPLGRGPPVSIVQEAGWAPELVWTQTVEQKSFAAAGDRTSIVRSSSP
jgi:hypothetical protein